MIIIPAIDIYENKLVKLSKEGLGSVTFYRRTPLHQARAFEDAGFGLIHVVDLMGKKNSRLNIKESIEELRSNTKLKIQLGGGIHDAKSAHEVFNAGIDYLVIGDLSVTDQREFELIVKQFSPERIIVDIEFANDSLVVNDFDGDIPAVKDHIDFCRSLGIASFNCTDFSPERDSVTDKTAFYKMLMSSFPDVNLMISGGTANISEVKQLEEINPYALIIGRALHEGWIDLKDAAAYTGL